MVYVIQNMSSGGYRTRGGTPIEFDNEGQAAEYIASNGLSSYWVIKLYGTEPWRVDARRMYTDGIAKVPVWHYEDWYRLRLEDLGHYPTINESNTELIDYFPDIKKAEKGITQSTKPGKYLKTFFGDILSEKQIKYFSDLHKESYKQVEVEWATTPDEIEDVYSLSAGFSSCMQYPRSHWSHGIHPTRAYGAGDLSIAYIKRGRTLLARALVWREKKKVGRVYGDVALLKAGLKSAGIETESDSNYYDTMEGAKLLYIPAPGKSNAAVLPYVDGERAGVYGLLPVEGDENVLLLGPGRGAKYQAVDQNAVIRATKQCPCCGKWQANSEVINLPGYTASANIAAYVEYLCNDCANSGEVFVDVLRGVYFSKKHYTPVPFFHYSDDAVRSGELVKIAPHFNVMAKEAITSGYEISEFSGYCYRSRDMITVNGKRMTRSEQDIMFFISQYDGVAYDKSRMVVLNNKKYTTEQAGIVQQSAFDLFLRELTY